MPKSSQTNKAQAKKSSEQSKTEDHETGAPEMTKLVQEIIEEAKRIALNQTSSCYTLVEKTKEYIAMEKFIK